MRFLVATVVVVVSDSVAFVTVVVVDAVVIILIVRVIYNVAAVNNW